MTCPPTDPVTAVAAARATSRRRLAAVAQRGPAWSTEADDACAKPDRGDSQIYVHPSGWNDAPWWDASQVDNILHLLRDLKERYNVDESRTYLTGISDGATGAYYLAMREPTPWSSILPLNGSIAVLRSPSTGVDGPLYGNNLAAKPLDIVNGEEDPLYPVWHVEPHIAWFVSSA